MENNYKVTFLNDNADKNLKEIGIASLESLKEDLEKFMEAESETGYYEVEDLALCFQYGLSFESVKMRHSWLNAASRWQLSKGGPTPSSFYPVARQVVCLGGSTSVTVSICLTMKPSVELGFFGIGRVYSDHGTITKGKRPHFGGQQNKEDDNMSNTIVANEYKFNGEILRIGHDSVQEVGDNLSQFVSARNTQW